MKNLCVHGGYEWWNLGITKRAFETGMSDWRRLRIDACRTRPSGSEDGPWVVSRLPWIEQMDLAQDRSGFAQSGRSGVWVWRYREAIEDPGAILSTCRRHSLSRVMIQMPASEDGPEIWRAYVRLLITLREGGIEVVALDGYPEAIYDPQQLAGKVRRLFGLVEPHLLAGVQLDIEPYLLPGFLDDEAGPIQYLNAIDLIKEMIGQRTHLSVVMPFWLTTVAVRGHPLAFAVMDRVDEVAVMSYRTDLDEVKSFSDDTLRYGDLIGIPVWLPSRRLRCRSNNA